MSNLFTKQLDKNVFVIDGDSNSIIVKIFPSEESRDDEWAICNKLKQLNIKNITEYYDAIDFTLPNSEEKIYAISMANYDSTDLFNHIREKKKPITDDWRQYAIIIRNFFETQRELNKHSIYHCDIKLENIIVVDKELYLIDFGAAIDTSCDDNYTYENSAGTIDYSSPEKLKTNGIMNKEEIMQNDIFSSALSMLIMIANIWPSYFSIVKNNDLLRSTIINNGYTLLDTMINTAHNMQARYSGKALLVKLLGDVILYPEKRNYDIIIDQLNEFINNQFWRENKILYVSKECELISIENILDLTHKIVAFKKVSEININTIEQVYQQLNNTVCLPMQFPINIIKYIDGIKYYLFEITIPDVYKKLSTALKASFFTKAQTHTLSENLSKIISIIHSNNLALGGFHRNDFYVNVDTLEIRFIHVIFAKRDNLTWMNEDLRSLDKCIKFINK